MCSTTIASTILRLQDIPVLQQPYCKIKNPEYVEKILNELVNGGAKKLQFITDFDFTVTKQRLDNGKKPLSSFCMLELCKSYPQSCLIESKKLNNKYHPIEIDPKISIEEKTKYMIEWWTKSNELLKEFPLDQSEIDEVTNKFLNTLRDGTSDLFKKLYELNVPLLVFSAGVGNTIESLLRQANILFPNVKIISNFLQYKNGLIDGFQNNIIHTFNKNESALKGTEYYNLIHDRDHVIVVGDSLSDAGMANGVLKTSYVLKIGFLFNHIEHNLERYMDTFDIVLIDDQTMNVPREIISLIEAKEKNIKP